MKAQPIIIFVSLMCSYSYAQIQVIADPRIEQKVAAKNSRQMPGYRVQLCFDSDKELLDQLRAQFVAEFPKIDTYVRFEAPNFNLMVGDFRTQKEAEELVERIRGRYPLTIVHKEQINLPRID
ncbi:MAG: SPOR domain-containing protein [Flavobacteriales bacterium]